MVLAAIISIDDQELEEVTRAKGSDDQCSVQVIFPQKTEEEIISAASDESRQGYLDAFVCFTCYLVYC